MQFKATLTGENFVEMEIKWLEHWSKSGLTKKYLQKNQKSTKKFSFLDGPITANNPMGVHHAWGRTYKDLFQRFFNMRGYSQRFQNGFDEQGLWVEVEVEKELGLKSKKDIENLVPGNKFASLEKFVNLCKERVKKYSAIQTEQSKRLGYFMDWDNSYHTSSDENNYAIWNFLKVVHKNGWLYKGRDSVPWCPRCGTAISQHEILTEEYKELTHDSIYIEYPIVGRDNEYLLVWTTTPWTLPANVVIAIDPEKYYVATTGEVEGNIYYLSKAAAQRLDLKIVREQKGGELVGLEYTSPFDHLPRVQKALRGFTHKVVVTDPLILPVTDEEGTGMVHTAPGAGSEDFQLGKKYQLPVIEVIDESANYLDGMEEFSDQNAKNHPELIIDFLKSNQDGKFLFDVASYTHRYPTCWRCKTELVWRVVDEWYIAMDKPWRSEVTPLRQGYVGQESQKSKPKGQTFREQMIEVAKKINWLPEWGLERELDWLRNMHDWLISKKRYWGLALPIWECKKCGNFEVIGSIEELKERAIQSWDKFENHSPHRPWVDEIKIKCSKCEELVSRIPDVGNPWLDAGIVPFSTMPPEWFPADFITESFPGQFKNWFYSLIAMSTALKNTNPFKTILGHASVRDEKGEEMHKSKGNAIEFNEAAERIGVDVMRWLYMRTNPEHNVNFGYSVGDEIRRFFILRFWNVYSFFTMYASTDKFKVQSSKFKNHSFTHVLDRWIVSRMNRSIKFITERLEKYDVSQAALNAEEFVANDLSNWYVRRVRDRVGPSAPDGKDKQDAYQTLWLVLARYCQVLAPFIPYLTEEIYTSLTGKESVHLQDWPESGKVDEELEKIMEEAISLSSAVRAFRKANNLKVRTPLFALSYKGPRSLGNQVEQIVLEEVNVGELVFKGKEKDFVVTGDTSEKNQNLLAGEARDLVRMVQERRKEASVALNDRIIAYLKSWPKEYEGYIKQQTLSTQLIKSQEIRIEKANK